MNFRRKVIGILGNLPFGIAFWGILLLSILIFKKRNFESNKISVNFIIDETELNKEKIKIKK